MTGQEIKTNTAGPGVVLSRNVYVKSTFEAAVVLDEVASEVDRLLASREYAYVYIYYRVYADGRRQVEAYVLDTNEVRDAEGRLIFAHAGNKVGLDGTYEWEFVLRIERGMDVEKAFAKVLEITKYTGWGFMRYAAKELMRVFRMRGAIMIADELTKEYLVRLI